MPVTRRRPISALASNLDGVTDQNMPGGGRTDTPQVSRAVGDRLEHGLERLEDRIEHGLETVRDVIKPRLRGGVHPGTFPFALAARIVLVVLSPHARSRVATAIFAVTAALLFGVSA